MFCIRCWPSSLTLSLSISVWCARATLLLAAGLNLDNIGYRYAPSSRVTVCRASLNERCSTAMEYPLQSLFAVCYRQRKLDLRFKRSNKSLTSVMRAYTDPTKIDTENVSNACCTKQNKRSFNLVGHPFSDFFFCSVYCPPCVQIACLLHLSTIQMTRLKMNQQEQQYGSIGSSPKIYCHCLNHF